MTDHHVGIKEPLDIKTKLAPHIGSTFMFKYAIRKGNTHIRVVAGAGLRRSRRDYRLWNKQGTDITHLVAELLGAEYCEDEGIHITENQRSPEVLAIIYGTIYTLNETFPGLIGQAFIADSWGSCINSRGQRI
jgi:hypothetical protein